MTQCGCRIESGLSILTQYGVTSWARWGLYYILRSCVCVWGGKTYWDIAKLAIAGAPRRRLCVCALERAREHVGGTRGIDRCMRACVWSILRRRTG